MDVVDVIKEWAFLEELDDGLEFHSFFREVSNLFVDIFDDLLLLNLERFSLCAVLRNLHLLLEHLAELIINFSLLVEEVILVWLKLPLAKVGFLLFLIVPLVV